MKPNVFIGSSSEHLDHAYALQEQLSPKAFVTPWNQGFFEMNVSYLDSLIDGMKDSDFGVFVFGPDDILKIREETLGAVRDNVLFEFGMFMGGLGKERVFFIVPKKQDRLRLPSDLLGISTVAYDSDHPRVEAALGPACSKILKAIEKYGIRQERLGSPAVEIVNSPRILCACSPQYLSSSFQKDVEIIRKETHALSTQILEMHDASSHELKNVLMEERFDIIHISAFVDPRTGEIYFGDVDADGQSRSGATPDSLPATSFAKLVELASAKLVVLATCDSLVLAGKLARVTNMIASTGWVTVEDMLDWELSFYKCLSKGVSLSSSYETAASLSKAPMLLLMKKDLAFTG